MPIYRMNNRKLELIKEREIDLERDIQKLTEENLEIIFGLKKVSSEFSLHNFRVDTMAFDPEAAAFVIIEYKRDRSFSVVDQGFAYLSLMLNNRADFVLHYNEKTKVNLGKDDVDWSQSRVIFLANSFTVYQQQAINFKDLPIELWEVKVFDNETVLYDRLVSSDSRESIKTISKSKTMETVSKEVKVYTLDDHLRDLPDNVKTLCSKLRQRILSLGDGIEERAKKFYIAYRTNVGFVYIYPQQAKLKVYLIVPKADLNDPKGIARDVSKIGHYGGGETEVILEHEEDLGYIMTLVEESYRASRS